MFGNGTEGHILSATIAAGVVTAAQPGCTIGASGVDVVSAPIDIRELDVLSFQLLATNTSAGPWSVEWCNNYSLDAVEGYGQLPNPGDWDPETAVAIPAAGGSGQNDHVEFAFRGARHARVRFTPSVGVGSGQVDCWLFGKGL